MKLIFLLEEPSMKYLLDELLPRILPPDVTFQTIPHHGKRDLDKIHTTEIEGLEGARRYPVCNPSRSRHEGLYRFEAGVVATVCGYRPSVLGANRLSGNGSVVLR